MCRINTDAVGRTISWIMLYLEKFAWKYRTYIFRINTAFENISRVQIIHMASGENFLGTPTSAEYSKKTPQYSKYLHNLVEIERTSVGERIQNWNFMNT